MDDGRITGPDDIEAMLAGCTTAERQRVIAGAIEAVHEQLRHGYAHRAELIRWRNELFDRVGYPSGYGIG